MATKNKKRMDANAKEVRSTDTDTMNGAEKTFGKEDDTEFGVDTFIRAALNPLVGDEKETGKGRDKISYDPFTQTERYQGENNVDGVLGNPSLKSEGNNRVKTRTIVDDSVGREDRGTRYETAAEIAPPTRMRAEPRSPVTQSKRKENPASGLGMTGLGLSILSLFLLPYLTAPVAMVIGYMAFRRGARTMGLWSMVISAIAILGALLVYPYFIAR